MDGRSKQNVGPGERTGEDVEHIYDQRISSILREGSGIGPCPATQGQDKDDPAECTTKPGLIHANACDAHPRNRL